ncbi:ABC transporter ATP-binding protein [Natrialbaceae archaeon A-CW1-1]
MSTPLLELEQIEKTFTSGGKIDRLLGYDEAVEAVSDVSFKLFEDETVALIGESGCGKSTLAKIIMGIHSPTQGQVRFKGDPLTSKQISEQPIQIIFQDPAESLNPRKTVGANIATPLRLRGVSDVDTRIDELLTQMGMDPSVKNRYPNAFSGGQKQRIAITRALATDPELLIADEPVSGLDVSVQAQIINLLDSLQSKENLSLLLISHNLGVVRTISDRVEIMYLGKIVERGKTEDVFTNPSHPYTQALLSAVHLPEPDSHSDRIILKGDLPSPTTPPSGCRFHTRCPAYIGDVCERDIPVFQSNSSNPNWKVDGNGHEARCHHLSEKYSTEPPPES